MDDGRWTIDDGRYAHFWQTRVKFVTQSLGRNIFSSVFLSRNVTWTQIVRDVLQFVTQSRAKTNKRMSPMSAGSCDDGIDVLPTNFHAVKKRKDYSRGTIIKNKIPDRKSTTKELRFTHLFCDTGFKSRTRIKDRTCRFWSGSPT